MERYTRVFSLPENLYSETSPLLIVAGALLKENETQRVLAQLKFRNLVQDRIKAVRVSVTLFDTVGKPLGEAVEYQYLDLSASRDEEFGQKKPLYLPDETTRSFSAQVTQVIFEDNTIWDSVGAWDALPAQELLSSVLTSELLKQYHINFGQDKHFVPNQTADLWRCGCGAINRQGEILCHNCRGDFSVLTNGLDKEILSRQREKRLADVLTEQREKRLAEVAQREAGKKAKRVKKVAIFMAAIAVIVIMCSLVVPKVIMPAIQRSEDYKAAVALYEREQYDEATVAFLELGDYKDAPELAKNAKKYSQDAKELLKTYRKAVQGKSSFITAGFGHTVGLKCDGTIVAVGYSSRRQCNVSSWRDIVAVSAGFEHTIGLKSDGTVMAVGRNGCGQCDVRSWRDIVAVSAGYNHTVGLKSNGTIVAVGENVFGQCDVSDWRDIVAVSAGYNHTVGLKSNGTVVAVGDNVFGQCDVSDWHDIVAVSAGNEYTVGLKSDGTVVDAGHYDTMKKEPSVFVFEVSDWHDIVAVSAGTKHTVGLKSDGTVVAVGSNECGECYVSSWHDIVAVSAGCCYTVGLKSDGTAVAVGYNGFGQCDVNGWRGIGSS